MITSTRLLFSVRKHDNEYILENICGTLMHKSPLMNLKDAFPAKAAQDIIQKCRLAISGKQDCDSFSADLGNHELYLVSLIHHDQYTSFFSAEPIIRTDNGFNFDNIPSMPSDQSAYCELCDASHIGMFAWQAFMSNEFFLIYANSSFGAQANLPGLISGRTYKELFVRKESLIERGQLNKCVNTKEPIMFTHEYDNKIFSVSLYPVLENGHVVRVVGTSIDITEQRAQMYQLECANKHLARSEQALREHMIFEELIARISREYMETGLSGFSACTNRLITGLGSLLKVDWACVWKSEDTICGTSSQWRADNVAIDMEQLDAVLNSGFGTWINHYRSGRITVINDLETENPHLLSTLLNVVKKDGIRSILVVPILRGGDLWGIICVSQNTKRIWTTIEISRLKVAADTIMSAYLRLKTENQLNESNRVLVEYDECLQDMLAVQESLAKVSKQYLSVDQFLSCTKDMLKILGELTDADHAFIHVFGDDTLGTYSWCKRGLPCINLQTNHVQSATSWMDSLQNKGHFTVSNVAEDTSSLPPFLFDKMLSLGIKSYMVVSIQDSDTMWGVLVLCKVLGCHHWSNTYIQTAKQFAEVFLAAYIRVCKYQQLIKVSQTHSTFVRETAKHTEILRKVAKSAQLFYNANAENLKDVFYMVCKEIAEVLQILSVCLTRYSEDFTKTCVILNWASSGRVSKRVDSLHDHHDHTVLSIPVLNHEAVWGCLLVNFASKKPSDEYMDALELMGEYCVQAYMRIFPIKQNCVSTSPEKTFRKALSLKTQPAVV